MKNGYYLHLGNKKEYFFITEQTRLTTKLLDKILVAFRETLPTDNNPNSLYGNLSTKSGRELYYNDMRYRLSRATYEQRTLANGITYENIEGENFGGYGSPNIDEYTTTLLYI